MNESKAFLIDENQMRKLRMVQDGLFGDGTTLSPDARRDLANVLFQTVFEIEQQPFDDAESDHEAELRRRVAQLKIENANRRATEAFCLLHDVYRLMQEAGASDEGIAHVKRALHHASGFQPEEFMSDFPVDQRVSAYWDHRYVNNDGASLDEVALMIPMHIKHKQFRAVEITRTKKDGAFDLRWTFDHPTTDNTGDIEVAS